MLRASVKIAFSALSRSWLRSILTTLGVLIGVASVVVVTALGRGARERVGDQIESLGSNLLFVWSQPVAKSGVRTAAVGLTDADALAIRNEATAVDLVTVYSDTKVQVISPYGNDQIQVCGVDANYLGARKFEVLQGRMWNSGEEQVKAKVALIGQTAIDKLFPGQDPIGHYIRLGKHPFRIIGTLKPKGQSPFEDQDDRILIPIGSWRARINPTLGNRVQLIMATAKSEAHTEAAVRQVQAILRQRHRIAEEEESDFEVRTQDAFKQGQQAIYGVLTLLLVTVAGVSLFVGGVGVMNIMLVSVTERTREIGIRMAIGAKRLDIQVQFLAEAVALTLLGGVAGIGLAVGVIELIKRSLGWSMVLSSDAVITAIITSLVIGVVFGFLPARRASRLDPIEALRHE
ncbi:MAG: ABC transporter permease [Polyangiaceae bacterium]|nr:ABC transporter permease [Polyangiaceae bacterium]MCB9608670.1 ABC transporter permease [Polyangiaceae bacterium]